MEYGSLKRILPVDNVRIEEFMIYSEAELIFEKLVGTKNNDFISNS